MTEPGTRWLKSLSISTKPEYINFQISLMDGTRGKCSNSAENDCFPLYLQRCLRTRVLNLDIETDEFTGEKKPVEMEFHVHARIVSRTPKYPDAVNVWSRKDFFLFVYGLRFFGGRIVNLKPVKTSFFRFDPQHALCFLGRKIGFSRN